jgi:hypothetical protein
LAERWVDEMDRKWGNCSAVLMGWNLVGSKDMYWDEKMRIATELN